MIVVQLVTNGWKEEFGPFDTMHEAMAARDKLVEWRQSNLSAPLRGHRTYSNFLKVQPMPQGL